MKITLSKGLFESPGNNQRKQVHIGSFVIELAAFPAQLRVTHQNAPERELLASVPGIPFVRAAMGEDDFTEGYGTFKIIDHDFYMTTQQSVDTFNLKTEEDGVCVSMTGKISSSQSPIPLSYSLSFDSPSASQLRFVVSIHDLEERFSKIFLEFSSTPDERFFGFGEQLTHFDLKGHKVPIMVREDGVGRGAQPTTTATNLFFGPYAGGDDVSAYKPVPFFLTSKLRCLFLESNDYSMFDLTKGDKVTIKVAAPLVVGRLIFGSSPLSIIEEYTTYSGRMEPLPDWSMSGVIAGIQGGEEKVSAIVKKMKDANVPLAALWLQDWCGKREQKVLGRILKRLWWNWENPNWPTFVEGLSDQGIEVLTYVNSFLADVELGGKPSFGRNLYKEALERNYLVRNEAGDSPLSISSGPNFRAGLVDLFNINAFQWLRDVMVEQCFKDPGVKGYMSDFAEFLPPGATLSDGTKATAADHNHYAEMWSRLQKEVLEKVGSSDKLIFHRSGFTRSPGVTRLFWTGDQLVSWDAYDGIKAGLVGILSSGLAGFSLNHSDVGGYSGLMVDVFGLRLGNWRTKELLLRWMELGAFGLVFRTHEGKQQSLSFNLEISVKFNAFHFFDGANLICLLETLSHMGHCLRIFASLRNYKKVLMEQAAAWGFPVLRHMFLHFHEDVAVFSLNEQFLLGQHLLIRPVMDPKTSSVKVYLPQLPNGQKWYSAYTKEAAKVESYPAWITVAAPLGRPAVFVDEGGLSEASLVPFFDLMKSL
ncbi:hypothetical protein HDU67_008592 [Dinochytrium kinnereticum]|nr:hypothetical protein HDU67_008592 [Dinochytrium kinnereticum]